MKRLTTLFVISIALFAGFALATTVRADNSQSVTIHAQGNAYFTDFIARSSKRGDLRVNMASKGIDVAFTEWLKAEHPDAYRESAVQAAASNHRDSGVTLATRTCCQKDGHCCQSDCRQCCAKGTCRMNCCPMKMCRQQQLACCA
jgi:hypothetical protein